MLRSASDLRLVLAGATLLAGAATAQARHMDEIVVVDRAHQRSLTTPDIATARTAIERTPGGVALVDDTSYRDGRVGNLQDALGYTAGVFIQPRFGADEARLSIRGSGVQRTFHLRGIQLLQDGVPLNLADGGGDFQSIDALTADYIEVYRGANALQFGAATLGGAINFVSPTGHTAPRFQARVESGSFDYQRTQVAVAGQHERVDGYLSANYAHSNGFRDHAEQQNLRLSGNVGVRLMPDLESRFYLYLADSDSELPGNLTRAQLDTTPRQANPFNLSGDMRRDFFQWRVSNRTVYTLSANQHVELAGFYSYKDLFHPIFQVLDIVSRDYGLNLRFVSAGTLFGHKNLFTAGFTPQWGDTDDDRFRNQAGQRGPRTNKLDQRAANYALFAENQYYVLDRLALITGLQLARSERRLHDQFLGDGDASFDRSYDAASPKLGLRYEIDQDVQLFTNISRSFEPPSFGELSGAQLINVVAAQRGTTFEIGSRGRHPLLESTWDVAWYHAWVDHEFLSLTDTRGQPLGTVSADDTVHQGLELALSHRLFERINIRQTYLWTSIRFDGDRVFGDNPLAGLPEHMYRAEFLYRWPQGWFFGPTVEWVPADYAVDHADTLRADGYAIVGLRAGYRSTGPIALFLDMRNLTDATYAATTGVIANARGLDSAQFLPGDGVAIYGGVELHF